MRIFNAPVIQPFFHCILLHADITLSKKITFLGPCTYLKSRYSEHTFILASTFKLVKSWQWHSTWNHSFWPPIQPIHFYCSIEHIHFFIMLSSYKCEKCSSFHPNFSLFPSSLTVLQYPRLSSCSAPRYLCCVRHTYTAFAGCSCPFVTTWLRSWNRWSMFRLVSKPPRASLRNHSPPAFLKASWLECVIMWQSVRV